MGKQSLFLLIPCLFCIIIIIIFHFFLLAVILLPSTVDVLLTLLYISRWPQFLSFTPLLAPPVPTITATLSLSLSRKENSRWADRNERARVRYYKEPLTPSKKLHPLGK